MRTVARSVEGEAEEGARSARHHSRAERKALGLVWIDCPYPVLAIGLQEVLADHARLHLGQEPPENEAPALIVHCPAKADDFVSELEYLRAAAPDAPILIFGLRVDPRAGKIALQAGARGFIHIGMQPTQIVNALSLARAGEVVIPGEILEGLMVARTSSGLETLTTRQQEIVMLVAEGLTNAQIAKRLYLSEFTIKQHLRHAYKILGVNNRTEAAKLFRQEH
jgi:DNA-binding NarL/FixJ family response regulator